MSEKYSALKEQYRSEVNSEHPNMAGFSRWLFDRNQKLETDRDLWKKSESDCNEMYNQLLAENEMLREGLDEIYALLLSSKVTNATMIEIEEKLKQLGVEI